MSDPDPGNHMGADFSTRAAAWRSCCKTRTNEDHAADCDRLAPEAGPTLAEIKQQNAMCDGDWGKVRDRADEAWERREDAVESLAMYQISGSELDRIARRTPISEDGIQGIISDVKARGQSPEFAEVDGEVRLDGEVIAEPDLGADAAAYARDTAMYAISGEALDEIERLIRSQWREAVIPSRVANGLGFIRAACENGPIPLLDAAIADRKALEEARQRHITLQRLHTSAVEQRNALQAMISASVQQHSGEMVARGLMGLAQAHAWAQDELAKVQATLAAIEQQHQKETDSDGP